ncbi:hypothetical protein COV20_06445 [Candidatus Woesearchaeota archaeon CG10_big_fil_rev_8_21_14_0_10_45_16]|nr:MAG: hypothetical protein COV20_06445 [Candidatus Woesearchaeota archaeon CG10_big_fil_rev_8_21_14_0_10_45_16]
MKGEIRKEILYDLDQTLQILEKREPGDVQRLEELSNHAIEDVALHKDLDMISVTVIIYSLYKIIARLEQADYDELVIQLKKARQNLERNNFGPYNRSIKSIYDIIHRSSIKVKEHLQDVMQAARIKKGTALLEKGLSIGQAAGLMGLSNWDLQQYASQTTALGAHTESIPAHKRLKKALTIFKIQ